jgi:ATP phosphoribosyltransferase regulatory subunit HisZ
MTIAPCVRSRDPTSWRDAERPGRVSYLPAKVMRRAYRSELARRQRMAEDEAEWRQVSIEIENRERSDAAVELLADAFASLLNAEFRNRTCSLDGQETQNNRI